MERLRKNRNVFSFFYIFEFLLITESYVLYNKYIFYLYYKINYNVNRGEVMEKIEIINEILKENFSVDIFDYDFSDKNNFNKKLLEKVDKYFTYKLSLKDIIKSIYGEDAEIITKEDIMYESPSNIEKLNLSNPDIDRILNLRDLGYKIVSINYYVKQGKDDNLIYIGTNKDSVCKYDEVLTESGFMSKLEKVLNIELNPNTEHAEIVYKKVWPDDSYCLCVPADFRNCETIIDCVNINNAIKTKDGNIIAKSINCKHFNGYSTDEFIPEKVLIDFNFKQNNLTSKLNNIPNEVLKELKIALKDYFYNNQREMVKDILVVLKEYINEQINISKEILFKTLATIYNLYPSIVENSSGINVIPPLINEKAIEDFKNLSVKKREKFVSKYDEDKNKIENDLNNAGIEIDNLQYEIEKILKHTEDCWDEFASKPSNIFGIDEEGDYDIRLDFNLENLYCDFVSFFKQEENNGLIQIEDMRQQIAFIREEIEYVRGFNIICHGDYIRINDNELPFDAAEELVNVIEEYLNKNSLVEEIIEKNKLYKSVENKLEIINNNYREEESIYSHLLYDLKSVSEAFGKLSYNQEQLFNFAKCLEKIDSIYYTGVKNSFEFKNLYFYIELFNSIINGNIFCDELVQNEKAIELLDSQKPIYKDDNYVTLIKNQLIKKY